jgi:DNA-binding NarL/FixJ family response regulator
VTDGGGPRIAVLADDLIWATRLASIVRLAGGEGVVVGTDERFGAALASADGAIVDLSVRGASALAGIAAAAGAGKPVIAVGPHEDSAARKQALAAGASRVYAYRKLFDDGPRTVASWLGLPEPLEVARR